MKNLLLLPLLALPLYAAEIDDLQVQLRATDVSVRRGACETLGKLGEAARPAQQALLGLLKDPDVQVRAGAAWAIGKIGAPDAKSVDALVEATADKDWTVRHNAAMSLVTAGEPAAKRLEKALQSDRPWQRFYAADSLVRIERKNVDRVLPAILEGMASTDSEMQSRAAQAVAFVGPPANAAAPAVFKLIEAEDPEVRISAVEAVRALGTAAPAGASVLIDRLPREKNTWLRCRLYTALGTIGKPEDLIVPALVKGLSDPSDRPMAEACEALAKMGPVAVDAVLEAIRLRSAVVPALDVVILLGPAATKAVPTLIELTKDNDWIVRLRATTALGVVAEPVDAVLQAVREAARDPHESVKANAESVLRKLEKAPLH